MTYVAKIMEMVGSYDKNWQDAAEAALNEAEKTIHGIIGVEIGDMTAKVDLKHLLQRFRLPKSLLPKEKEKEKDQ